MYEDRDSFDSNSEVDESIWRPEAVKEFTDLISKYRVKTDLDQRLLVGVLVRDWHLKKFDFSNSHLTDRSGDSVNNRSESLLSNPLFDSLQQQNSQQQLVVGGELELQRTGDTRFDANFGIKINKKATGRGGAVNPSQSSDP